MHRRLPLLLKLIACACVGFRMRAQEIEPYEQEPFNYSKAVPHDAIEALKRALLTNSTSGERTDRQLVSILLAQLNISADSQILVFSKTSFQRQRISPQQPRALYFNDTCYVGWVPGGLIEVAAIDPVLGPMFYSVNPAALRTNATTAFVRDSDCMRCHGGSFVRGIPGVFARSVFPDAEGEPLLKFGSEVVDYRTPFTNRWGGWYVTGTHGNSVHRGNVLARDSDGHLLVDVSKGANVTNLSGFFGTADYLRDTSDILALLIFEHQTAMQNALTQASLSCRKMLKYQRDLQVAFKEPLTDEPKYDSVKSVFDSCARDVVDALLFKDEAELPSEIHGSSGFEASFLQSAKYDANGNSLRELAHGKHLFRNRCSYLIYSDAFRQLPSPLKTRIYERLEHALRSKDADERYAYLDPAERSRIVSILCATDTDWKARFLPLSQQRS